MLIILLSTLSLVLQYTQAGCQSTLNGQFNFRAYQLVIAVGVLAFLQNLGHLTYYVLPVDSNRQKYLPGEQLGSTYQRLMCATLAEACIE